VPLTRQWKSDTVPFPGPESPRSFIQLGSDAIRYFSQPFCSKPLQWRPARVRIASGKSCFSRGLRDGLGGRRGTEFDNRWGAVSEDQPDSRDKHPSDEPDEAPETPLDEPRPPRVEDPPPQPGSKGPYVVHSRGSRLRTEAER